MTRTKEYEKLNSIGSLSRHIPTNIIYSYRTPIYQEFYTVKGLLKCFNDTYYSRSTCKHQAQIGHLRGYADLIVHYCPYGEWSLDTALKNEITNEKPKKTQIFCSAYYVHFYVHSRHNLLSNSR